MKLSKDFPQGLRLLAELAEFEAKPGRYSLVMREPGLLFDQVRHVLMLALGRAVPELSIDSERALAAQRSAKFFVRMALFRSGADHYTVLGLWPGFTETELRDRYRLLMRLTHPDFIAADQSWPADAATRVNRAYEVLSSSVKKAEYDRAQSQRPQQTVVTPMHLRTPVPRAHAYPSVSPHKVWLGIGAACAVIVLVWASVHDWRDNVEVVSLNMENLPPAKPATSQVQTQLQVPAPQPALPSAPADPEPTPAPVAATAPAVPPAPPAPVLAVAAPPAPAAPVMPEPVARKTAERRQVEPERHAKPKREVPVQAVVPVQSRLPAPTVAKAVVAAPEATPVKPEVAAKATAVAAALPVPEAKPVEAPPQKLTVADVQPLFVSILQAMQTGKAEALTQGLDRAVRNSEGAMHLTQVYRHLIGGSSEIKVGQVQLRGKPDADQIAVDGVVRLHLLDQGQPAPVRELRMRAVFARQAGQIVLTQLSTGG
jgi:DnaJ domain